MGRYANEGHTPSPATCDAGIGGASAEDQPLLPAPESGSDDDSGFAGHKHFSLCSRLPAAGKCPSAQLWQQSLAV